MALLDLVARWAAEAPGRPPVFAATVDHGLRAASGEEAQVAARFAAACGVPHAVLPWEGEKPATRLQETARAARYELLAREARRIGADFVLTAHHADDQAETILMRLGRGSAIAGLAGMAALSARDGLMLFRPLLGVRKAALVDRCEREGVSFVRDPSNENPRFARTGARRLAALLEAQGLGPHEWARLARRAARAEEALAAGAAAALANLPAGPLPMEALAALPQEIALRCLAARALAAGAGKPARLERTEAAWDRLAAAHGRRDALALTLAGAQIALDLQGALTFSPEPPRRRGRTGAAAPQSVHVNVGKSAVHEPVSGASLGNGVRRA
ncbi:MAG: tRNA lysidine(34) synthetase TilS [Beijerinckiaceae bacterium]|nr:tRNA lysidine(34) synthetase TilS [Beijerinckiaceae bacterium]